MFAYFDVVAEVLGHDSLDDVPLDVVPGMAHVRLVVDCGATDVPRDLLGVLWDEFVLLKFEQLNTTSLINT